MENTRLRLQGLTEKSEIEEIKKDLEDQMVPVEKVIRMKGTRDPLFLIITDNQVTIRIIKDMDFAKIS